MYDATPLTTVLQVVARVPLARWEVSSDHLPLMGGRVILHLFENPSLQPAALTSFNPINIVYNKADVKSSSKYEPGKDFTHVLAVAVLTASFGTQPFIDEPIRLAVSVVYGLVSAVSRSHADGKLTILISNLYWRLLTILTVSALCSTDLYDVLESFAKGVQGFLKKLLRFFIYTRKHNTDGAPKSSFAKEARHIYAASGAQVLAEDAKDRLDSGVQSATDILESTVESPFAHNAAHTIAYYTAASLRFVRNAVNFAISAATSSYSFARDSYNAVSAYAHDEDKPPTLDTITIGNNKPVPYLNTANLFSPSNRTKDDKNNNSRISR